MKKLKVVTIVGTRPEIIRLSRLIPKLDEHTDHVLVHTGQNSDRQLNEVFFEDLELRQPDYYFNVDTSSMGSVMGDVLKKSEEVFTKEMPDAVMILGDTNSAVAAIVAERMHIPVYHMEAGNRSFDANVPEELNRKMIDHVSSFNLPYSDLAYQNLISEGIHPAQVHKTGSPIYEVYRHFEHKVLKSTILDDLGLEHKNYILVSVHRQENVDNSSRLMGFLSSLQFVKDRFGLPVLVSTHPRTRKRLEAQSNAQIQGIRFHEPFSYLQYSKLQLSAAAVISDSGTISEEANIMGFPAVSPRFRTERPEAVTSPMVLTAEMTGPALSSAIEYLLTNNWRGALPDGYSQEHFSDVVLSILFSTIHTQRYASSQSAI